MLHVAPSGSAVFHLPGTGIDDIMLEPHRASVDGACRIPLGSAMSFICTKPCLVDVARRIPLGRTCPHLPCTGIGKDENSLTWLVLMELVASLRGRPCLSFALGRVCVDVARRIPLGRPCLHLPGAGIGTNVGVVLMLHFAPLEVGSGIHLHYAGSGLMLHVASPLG